MVWSPRHLVDALGSILSSPVTSVAIGVFGLTIAIYALYVSTRPRWRIYYRISNYPWVRDWNEDLVALNVGIWNGGTRPIKSEDVASDLFINTPQGVNILSTLTTFCTNPHSRAHIRMPEPGSTAIITFDYLNPHDGAVFQVTLRAARDTDVDVVGDIIGGGSPRCVGASPINDFLFFLSLLVTSWILFFAGLSASHFVLKGVLMTIGVAFYPIMVGPGIRFKERRRMPRELFAKFKERPRL